MREVSAGARALLLVTWATGAMAAGKVDFAREVQPILHSRCAGCHSGDKPQAKLSVLTRAGLLAGGLSGPAVKPGSSGESLLIRRVSEQASRMPLGQPPLTNNEIAILRDWVDAGAAWDAGVAPIQVDTRIKPRRPAIPASSRLNPIDAFVERKLREKGIPVPPVVGDPVFARRAYFDLTGLPPTPEELDRFVNAAEPEKRERLVDQLLGQRQLYAEHWMSLWNDLLRNEDGVAYPGEKREWITRWLLQALKDNLPYNRMVEALLNPVGPDAPKAFLAGVNWGGDVSASQSAAMQAAQNSAQVFLGANLKCASCHDSFVSRWKVAQTFGLAAFFSADPIEIARCEMKTGVRAVPAFLFPEMAEGEPQAQLSERRAQVARMFTSPANGRFARTLVNRYWKVLFGRGIVEPVDDIEAAAWDPDLLDWLAWDFAEHNYDLQLLLRRIMTSRAYQMETARESAPPKTGEEFFFRGPLRRRLTAEQFSDAVSAITGEWKIFDDRSGQPAPYARQWRFRSEPLTRAMGRPERFQVVTDRSSEATTLQALELVNGEQLRSQLRRGARRLTGTYHQPPPNSADSGQVRTTAVKMEADLRLAKRVWLMTTDFGSYDRSKVLAGWLDAEFVGPQGSTRLLDLPLPAGAVKQPIQIKGQEPKEALIAGGPGRIVYDIEGKGYTQFRGSVGLDESGLRSEITAKVRFFVFTEEPDKDELVRTTGDPPVARRGPESGENFVRNLFRYAVSRDPGPSEMRDAKELLGQGAEGVEDLLWILFLSPEFQFLR
jgi:Protein of unknown function (DUF1549)/Protein of unknown function (DUF1553)/Planctomycete cytochrome C